MLVIIIIPTGCCTAKQARPNITLLCPVFRAGGGVLLDAQKILKTRLIYSRLSLSRNRRDHHEHFEISVLRHIRFVILRKKEFEQPILQMTM